MEAPQNVSRAKGQAEIVNCRDATLWFSARGISYLTLSLTDTLTDTFMSRLPGMKSPEFKNLLPSRWKPAVGAT